MLLDSTLTKLKALPQPAGDEATLSALYDDVAHLSALASQMAMATSNLDEAKFDDWLALYTDDATYWVPLAQAATTVLSGPLAP